MPCVDRNVPSTATFQKRFCSGRIIHKPSAVVSTLSVMGSAVVMFLFVSFVSAAQQTSFQNALQKGCAMGPLRANSSNPRYFVDACDNAVYLTGSHTHLSFKDGGERPPGTSPLDYDKYLDLLEANNHNFMRMWSGWELTLFEPQPWKRTGPGAAQDGRPKFDLAQLDESYFERLRARVLAARERNIYVSVMLFEGWLLRFIPDSATQHPFHPANNVNGIDTDTNRDGVIIEAHTLNNSAVTAIQEAYARKVVDTLNDLDNVLYEVANESAFPESLKWQYHMINFIKKYQARKPQQHPVGMTSAGFSSSYDDLADLLSSPADWISPGRPISLAYDYLENPPPADGSKVIISDSDHLASELKNPSWIWKSMTRGLNPIFMDVYPPLDTLGSGDVTVIRKNMGYARMYAEKIDLLPTTPRADLTSTRYMLANPGVEYLVYQPGSGSFTANLQSGQYQYEWFDPTTGSIAEAGSFTAPGGNMRFSPPFSGSAVLYIRSDPRANPSPSQRRRSNLKPRRIAPQAQQPPFEVQK